MRTYLHFARVFIWLAFASLAVAQQNTGEQAEQPAKRLSDADNQVQHLAQPAPKHYYKLNFVLRETEDSKVLNQRNFVMDISAEPPGGRPGDWWNLRAGTRVPLQGSNPKDVNYVDVGVNLDLRADELPDGLQMQLTSEISSVGAENTPNGSAPPIRQVKVKAGVFAALGKPTMVFTADDPGSRHRFELEVTPVKVK